MTTPPDTSERQTFTASTDAGPARQHDHDRQARIDRALSVDAEKPDRPDNWRARFQQNVDRLAETLVEIDEQISETNQMLHRTQGVRAGKISVRFLCLQRFDRDKATRDRVPAVVLWHGRKGQPATRYRIIPRSERYVRLRRKGANDEATKQLLRMLQELMAQRAKVEACYVRVAAAATQICGSTHNMLRRMESSLNELNARFIKRDYARADDRQPGDDV